MKQENPKKILTTLLSFAITVSILLMLRITGLVYFESTLNEMIAYDPWSATNLVMWIGLLTAILVDALVLNMNLSTEKAKLNGDLVKSAITVIVVVYSIGYNYVGIKYPYLFFNLTWIDKIIRTSKYVTIFAATTFTDVFWYWMLNVVIFDVVFVIFSLIDTRMFSTRTKAKPELFTRNTLHIILGFAFMMLMIILIKTFIFR